MLLESLAICAMAEYFAAGFYVPYIANYLYEHPGLVPLNLQGTWVTDPSLSWDIVQEYIPALPFAQVSMSSIT